MGSDADKHIDVIEQLEDCRELTFVNNYTDRVETLMSQTVEILDIPPEMQGMVCTPNFLTHFDIYTITSWHCLEDRVRMMSNMLGFLSES